MRDYYSSKDFWDMIKDEKKAASSPIFIPKKSTKIKNKIRNKRKR